MEEQSKPDSICRKLAADLYLNRTGCDGAAHPDTCPTYGCMRHTHDVDSYIALTPGPGPRGRSIGRNEGGIRFENAQSTLTRLSP